MCSVYGPLVVPVSFSALYISRSYFSVHLGDLVFPEVFLSQPFGEHLVAACARGFKLFSNRRLFFFPPKGNLPKNTHA